MDLVTLVTACALTVDPKLMHALVWHQSGGEPWAIAVQGELSPRAYSSMNDAIRETRSSSVRGIVRAGLAGVPAAPARVSASVLLPCRNVTMAAIQIAKHNSRCKTYPRLKADPTFCAIAIYRGSWQRPDIRFASDVVASVANGDAPNFDMPRDTSTEVFDIADDHNIDAEPPVIDITASVVERMRGWSSALFPTKSAPLVDKAKPSTSALPLSEDQPLLRAPTNAPSGSQAKDRDLFVRRVSSERPR